VKVKYPTISEAAFNKTMNINNPKDPVAGFLTQDHPEFLSVKTFAQILGVHWFTVWRWTVENVLDSSKLRSAGKS
jgi:hypothetical protein